jgi:hypothetical protein
LILFPIVQKEESVIETVASPSVLWEGAMLTSGERCELRALMMKLMIEFSRQSREAENTEALNSPPARPEGGGGRGGQIDTRARKIANERSNSCRRKEEKKRNGKQPTSSPHKLLTGQRSKTHSHDFVAENN